MELVHDEPASRESEAEALRFDDVSRVHGEGAQAVTALASVSFSVARGEFVAIMGPSGSGKSTLLCLCGALDQPTTGTVRVHGRDLAKESIHALAALRRRFIGYVFQDLNLLPGLTALENVSLPLELDGVPLREAREAARETLAQMKIESLQSRVPDDLSGGEQQRVAIARALVGPRELLLADEPTGALDSVTGELVMRSIRAQCDRGRTAIVVTHDAAHAAWADRVLFLKDGALVDEAAARDRSYGSGAGDRA